MSLKILLPFGRFSAKGCSNGALKAQKHFFLVSYTYTYSKVDGFPDRPASAGLHDAMMFTGDLPKAAYTKVITASIKVAATFHVFS